MTHIEPQLPLDIPLSHAPRQQRGLRGRVGPHSSLACAQSRLVLLGTAFAAMFSIVALRLIDATLLQPAADIPALAGPAQPGTILPTRANLTDRNGELLATSLPVQSLYADPAKLLDPVEAARGIASALPELKFEDVLDKLMSAKRFVWIKRALTPEEVYRVNALGQPGLEFETEQSRLYPAGPATAHVIGYTDVDGKGLSGLERGLNEQLTQGGQPVALSLDLRLQHILEREMNAAIKDFRAVGGAGVVMDLYSGEVLAAVSLPDYKPADVANAGEEARFNRFALGSYEFGSVLKIINTAAALESGQVSLNSFYDATKGLRFGRHTINDFRPENRELSVAEIFIHSSNIGSAKMAMDMGGAYQRDFICKLGLCGPLKTELPEMGPAQVPAHWAEVNSATIAFGHGISFTLLHLMQAVGATLTGHLVTPTFVKHERVAAPLGAEVVSYATVDKMRRLMRANAVAGSGKNANIAGYFVGGKTGTAEKTTGRRYSTEARLSSFIAAFPMDNPRYLIHVMIDEPRPNAHSQGYATGGWVAAPVVGRVIEQMGPLYGMAPRAADDAQARRALQLDIRSRREPIETY